MMDSKFNIEALEYLISAIKDEKIVVTKITTNQGEFIVSYKQIPKKEYKSQADIYDELYNDEYGSTMFDISDNECRTTKLEKDVAKRKATQYAVENTVETWKAQYE